MTIFQQVNVETPMLHTHASAPSTETTMGVKEASHDLAADRY